MDAGQIFATGGATGTVGVVLFLIYKFLTTKHRIRSNCFGKVLEIETEVSPPDKNISVVVDGSSNPITRHQAHTYFFKAKDVKEDHKGRVSGSGGDEEVKSHNRPACGECGQDEGAHSSTEPVPEPRE